MLQDKTFLISEGPGNKLYCQLTLMDSGYKIRLYTIREYVKDDTETIELGAFDLTEIELEKLRLALTPQ